MALTSNKCGRSLAGNFKLFESLVEGNFNLHSLSFRCLRGSRLGRELSCEEVKYEKLIKGFKSDAKGVENKEGTTPQRREKVSLKRISKKQFKSLEERITPLKHLPYDKQLERKHQRSVSFLQSFGKQLEALKVPIALGEGKLPCPVDFVLPSPLTEEYRNKDEFSIGLGADGITKTVGFFTPHEGETSEMFCESPDHLIITKNIHKSFIKDVEKYVRATPLPVFSPRTGEGFWKNVIVRSNQQGELLAVLVVHPHQKDVEEQKSQLRQHFAALPKSYRLESLSLQASGHSQDRAPSELLLGQPSLCEQMSGLQLQLSPDSFFLANTGACEAMYRTLLRRCRIHKSTVLIDVCTGVGPLSLLFSDHAKECIGVDESVSDALANATRNAKSNVVFLRGQPEAVVKDVLREGFFEDLLVVLNPSRATPNRHLMRTLRECRRLKKIVYITNKMAADMDNFVELCKPCGPHQYLGKAFLPISALPVDLNPHTEHVGLLLVFQRL